MSHASTLGLEYYLHFSKDMSKSISADTRHTFTVSLVFWTLGVQPRLRGKITVYRQKSQNCLKYRRQTILKNVPPPVIQILFPISTKVRGFLLDSGSNTYCC